MGKLDVKGHVVPNFRCKVKVNMDLYSILS